VKPAQPSVVSNKAISPAVMPRPFRFGLSTNRPRSKSEWTAFARHVEALGYDTLVISDHVGARLAIAPALVLAAAATTRLRVGSFVYDNDFRHPALLAQEIATVDLLTDGRFDFGIGAGWLRTEYDAAGLPFDPGGIRVERLTEAVRLITQLLNGAPVTFSGRHYQVKELRAGFKTVQQPHPPLVIGGGGRRLLTFAAQEANTISLMPRSRPDGSGLDDADATEEAFLRKLEWVKQAAGDRLPTLSFNTLVQTVIITDDRDGAVRKLSAEWKQPVEQLLVSPLVLIGTVDEIVATVQRRREQLGIGSITVFEKDIDNFRQVIERLRR
jgi:probable F420-dependent oxidoreductase